MFYSTRGWLRDLVCLSAFVVLCNTLADSGYAQPNTIIQVMPLTASAGPGTNAQFQVQVTNTGPVTDAFLIYGATDFTANAQLPALLGELATEPVIAPGQSFTGTLLVPVPTGTAPGSIPILIIAAGQKYGGRAPATINVVANGAMGGVTASFQPSSQNTPAVFTLIVQNTGSVQDTYTAAITNINGSIQANLVNLDGTSTQQNPQFTLPGLARGQLSMNASGTPPGSVTVTITSLTNPTVTATATANICQNCAQAPIASARAPQIVSVGTGASLDGSGSSDPNTPPLPLTYNWTLVSAPAGSSVSSAGIWNASTAMASFTPDVAGPYTFQLTVNNGTFSASANVTITASGGTVTTQGNASLPPVAVAGKNRNVANGKYFLLDGSASYDPGAFGLTYQWSLESAPNGSIAALSGTDIPEPAFRPDVAGAYVFQLIVNNGAYSSPPATVTISAANSGNIAPNANAGSALHALRGAPSTVDASASYDPDNGPKPLTYSWQFTQVPTGSALTGALKGSGTTATFTPDVSGAYTLTLSVSDGAATGTDTVVVTASDANVTPNANAGKLRRALPNVAVTLDGSGSNDPDKDALTYEWQLASGAPSGGTIQNATSAAANFTAPAAGQYATRLDVNDGQAGSFQQVAVIVGATCDGNGDGVVSQIDLDLIAGLIGAAVPANDPLDANGDGLITAADLAACSLQLRAPTTLSLASSANPATPGQRITFTATLTSNQPGTPSGTIEFLDGAVVLGTVAVSDGQAAFTTSISTGDTHTITAQYSGDTVFQTAQTSLTQNLVFPAAVSLVLKLTSSANPSPLGQSVTFTATFTATGGSPTGTVQFFDGSTLLGAVPVIGGKAVFSTATLTGGSHAIIAKYTGDKSFQPALASIGEVISPLASTLTLTSSAPSVALGQSIAFTARVIGAGNAVAAAPTGQVLFEDNGSPAGTATLTSGTATLTLTTLGIGDHTITAFYTGDSNWTASHTSITVSVILPTLNFTNAASNFSSSFAPDEIVSMFNVTGLPGDAGATLPLTTSLGGVSVVIKDSAGAAREALLYGAFASTGQVNFVIPSGTAKGVAKVTVTGASGSQTAQITVTDAAPGLFTAGQNGRGVATGQIVVVHADGSHTVDSLATLSGNTYVATAIKLTAPTDQVFLQLYGTGIRHAAKVTATLGGTPVTLPYAGQQGTYPGLDQVNLQLPKGLQASGAISIVITAGTQPANTVMVLVQ
jgi:uncharacterized protein (TIGR03437 family)